MFQRLDTASSRVPPGPSNWLILGGEFWKNPLMACHKAWQTYGDLVRFTVWPGRHVMLAVHPDMVETVVMKHGELYEKGKTTYEPIALLTGHGVLVSEGDKWRRRRKLMQPALSRESVAGFAPVMTQCAREHVEQWLKRPNQDQPVEITSAMQHLTLDIVCRTLFGADLEADNDTFAKAFRGCAHFVDRRINTPMRFPMWMPLPSHQAFKRDHGTLSEIALRLIRARRASGELRRDLLGMLIAAQDDEGGPQLTDDELRDEVITLIIAGHETVAVSLTWAIHALSRHREVRAKLDEELERVLNGRPPEPSDFMALDYTRRVIQETMRIWPPVWGLSRQAIADNELGGYPVPKGMMVSVSAYSTHRHPEFWCDPETFNPDRFTEAESAKRPRFAYYPFAGGPRVCAGERFAMVEATLSLATMAQRFDWQPLNNRPVEIDPTFTLRPKGGLRLKLINR